MTYATVAALAFLAFMPGTTSAIVEDPEGIRTEALGVAKYKVGALAGTAVVCASHLLGQAVDDVYVYKDRQQGQHYSVSVLYGVTTGGVRVAWNNQMPYTYEGVRVMMTSGSFVFDKTYSHGITGECGERVGSAHASTFTVTVEFGGTNVQITDTTQEEHALTVTTSFGGKFKASLTDVGAEASWRFDVSGTVALTSTISITRESKMKEFSQTYSDSINAQLHPVDTDIDTDLPPIPFVDLQ